MTCPKTTILGAALPHSRGRRPGGTGGQPVLWRIVAVGWPGPPAAQVLVARSLMEKSPRTRRPLPALCSEPPTFCCGEVDNLPLIYHQKTGCNGDAFQKFSRKYFFMRLIPQRTEHLTALLSTPSSRAISR